MVGCFCALFLPLPFKAVGTVFQSDVNMHCRTVLADLPYMHDAADHGKSLTSITR